MRSSRPVLTRVGGLVTLVALLLATGVGGASGAGAATVKVAPATLNASGATFPLSYYQVIIGAFKQKQKAVTVNYGAGGSGKGRQDFSDQLTDFGASDAPFSAADAAKVKGGPFFYFPTVTAPITVSYHVTGLKSLKLSADTIAGIFMRKIKTWNDPAIATDNPGTVLPSTAITVARRSDSSGTTENFTKFLAKAAPTTWTLGSGSTVSWPSDTQGGSGNGGVSQIVDSTNGSIGYVDYSDAVAVGLKFASVKNSAGKFIKPSLAGASSAVEGVTVNPDLTYDPINASGATAYPIAAPTWLLVYKTQPNKAKGDALKALLTFIYGDGQKLAPTVDYAPLPAAMIKLAKAQLNQVAVPAA